MYSSELDQKVADDLQPIQVLCAADSEGEGFHLLSVIHGRTRAGGRQP